MSALTPYTRDLILGETYEDVLAQIGDALVAVETNALTSYWDLGDLVDQFTATLTTRKYGKKSMEDLAGDLQAKGHLSAGSNTIRWLYWAKTLRTKIPREKLVVYVRRGLGITIVKELVRLDPAIAKKIEDRLFANQNGIPTVRDFSEMVREEISLHNARIVHAEPETLGPETLVEGSVKVELVDSRSDGTSAADPWLGAADGGPSPSAPAAAPAKSEKPSKTEKPGKTEKPAPSKSSVPDRPVSPLKALKVLDDAAQKIISNLGDALIAFNAVEKRGFDSDKATANFEKKVNEARASLRDAMEAVPAFLKATSRE